MKKHLLLIIAIMSLATIQAYDFKNSTNTIGVNNRFDDAVTFVERGVKFHIFLNGEFDFNTHRNGRYGYGIRIKRDHRGRVRRVGNVFINYDFSGSVRRIGNVYMNYRFGQLTRVGNLRITYDRWGNPLFRGRVKNSGYYYNDGLYGNNNSCGVDVDINIGDIYDYDDAFFYRNNFRKYYRQVREDDNFYYYRATPNSKLGKRSQIIKRRKQKKKRSRR
ncbi:hypothetical protein [Tenacibaculum amylolyticum]|uniref:hypothetical protein n=1 Tax=Tenacibaculum amylolyticum TaxID=104269 RepID=UPI00389565B7